MQSSFAVNKCLHTVASVGFLFTLNFWLLVHLAFTTANSVHLCTTDYLLSLSDTDTNSQHLPIADIANRESIHVWEGEDSHSYSLASARMHTKLYLFSFNTESSQRSTTSLSPHLLGCLVRDLNYGPWPVTATVLHTTDHFENTTLTTDDGIHGVPKHVGGDFVHMSCIYSSAFKVGFIS